MEIFDVSVPVHPGMPVYPGDPEVALERVQSLAAGGVANVSRLALGVHTGTHVDAPLHFFDGATDAAGLPLRSLVGPVRVLDVRSAAGPIGPDDLPAEPAERLLLRTRGGDTGLAPAAARRLVDRGVALVGIDTMSIGDLDVHRILLGAGVVPVEGLDLGAVEPGDYLLVCAPLRLVGSDGGPARVLLVRG